MCIYSYKKLEEYYKNFERMQGFIINDLISSTVKAKSNFLVAMGIFNYMEILGSFTYPKKEKDICSKRFNHTLNSLFPNSYIQFRSDLKKLSGNKENSYKIFRCGLTHEYIIKTYIKKRGVKKVKFEIYGVNNELEYQIMTQTKTCGIKIHTFDSKNYIIRLYNPCLINDLNIAFEEYKKRLMDNLGNIRKSFMLRCKNISFDSFN